METKTIQMKASTSSASEEELSLLQPVTKFYLKAYRNVDIDDNGRRINEEKKWRGGAPCSTPLTEAVWSDDEADVFMLAVAYPTAFHDVNSTTTNEDGEDVDNNKSNIFDINRKGKHGNTGLHLASSKGNYGIAKLLIDSGANVQLVDNSGRTPLHRASRARCHVIHNTSELTKHESVARLLIENGADVKVIDNEGSTPLHDACGLGKESVARLLIKNGADVKAKNYQLSTPLHYACRKGKESLAQLLIEKGADVKATDNEGNTPLHYASKSGLLSVVKLLLEKGADINAVTTNVRYSASGKTPLHYACSEGERSVAKLLIEKGADIKISDSDGDTPLHCVSIKNSTSSPLPVVVVELLLEKDAEVDAVNEYDETPLFHIFKYQYFSHGSNILGNSVIKLLFDKGANTKCFMKPFDDDDDGDEEEEGEGEGEDKVYYEMCTSNDDGEEGVIAAKIEYYDIRDKYILVPAVESNDEEMKRFDYDQYEERCWSLIPRDSYH